VVGTRQRNFRRRNCVTADDNSNRQYRDRNEKRKSETLHKENLSVDHVYVQAIIFYFAVILSRAQRSRRTPSQVVPRDPSTSLGMTEHSDHFHRTLRERFQKGTAVRARHAAIIQNHDDPPIALRPNDTTH